MRAIRAFAKDRTENSIELLLCAMTVPHCIRYQNPNLLDSTGPIPISEFKQFIPLVQRKTFP